MRRVRLLCALVGAAIVLACGGGGGGGGTPTPSSTLTFITDWTRRASPGGGLSQRITLTNELGVVVKTLALDSPGPDVVTIPIEGVPLGSYEFRAELFAQAGLAGGQVGLFEMPVEVSSGPKKIRVAVGATPESVRVLPEVAAVTVPRGKRFFAHVENSEGVPTFAAAGSFTWSVLGTIGTVNSSGAFQATTAGQGAVRATHVPTGRLGAASVTTQPATIDRTKWTVLVYMSAASDLYPYSDLNLNQLERVAGNPEVRFVVQWKQSRSAYPNSSFDGTRRYEVKPDQGSSIVSDLIQDLGMAVDMGRPDTLREFVEWGKTYYPSDRTVLVIWGHGNGWRRKPNSGLTRAVAYDDQTRSAIQIWELKQALTGNKVDILAWDASLMQMLEVAFEVRSIADYVVGSEESPPAEGYPYDTVFARFRDQADAPTRDLAKAFVDGMLGVPAYASRKITQSVLESSKLDALERAVDGLAVELRANSAALAAVIPTVRDSTQSYSPSSFPPRHYRDLYDVCLKLEQATDIPSLDLAAALVRQRITEAVAWEGHNANSPGSRGVSIDFSAGTAFQGSANDYFQLEFGQRNRWDDWLLTAP